jgi:hypothetical protein
MRTMPGGHTHRRVGRGAHPRCVPLTLPAVVVLTLLLAINGERLFLVVAVAVFLLAIRARLTPPAVAAVALAVVALLHRFAGLRRIVLAAEKLRSLQPSGPIVVTKDAQSVENLDILGIPGRAAILVIGKRGVKIRNCRVRHPVGCHGIELRSCPAALIENCDFSVPAAPGTGPLDRETNAIEISESPDAVVRRVRMRDCSSGVYALHCARLLVKDIEGYNQRGPFPRGNLVQFNRCDEAHLENFYAFNDVLVANTEDNISIFQSLNCTVRRGLIDGNNAPSGACVIFENSDDGVCEDVDAIRFSNSAFSAYPGKRILFLRCRARDSYRPTPRGEPSSKSIVFAASPQALDVRVRDSVYFAHVNPGNVVWDRSRFVEFDLRYGEFPPRDPLRLTGLPGEA